MPEQEHTKEPAKHDSHDTGLVLSGAVPGTAAAGPSAILRLQQLAGNRAVTQWLGRQGGTGSRALQRAPAEPSSGDRDEAARTSLEAIRALVTSKVVSYRNAFTMVPAGEADALIQVVAVYVESFPDNIFDVTQIKDLVDLLAPWGFKGAHYVRENRKSKPFLNVGEASESLLEALKKWKSEDQRARAKSRQRVPKVMGTVMHSPTAEDIEVEEATPRQEVLETGEVYTGPKSAMRDRRKAAHQTVVMQKVGAVQTQGPGGFVGMGTGYGIGLLTGRDPMWAAEAGQAFGTAFDPLIGTAAAMRPMPQQQGAPPPAHRDSGHVEKAPPREPMPTPDMPARVSSTGGGSSSGGGGAPAGSPSTTMLGTPVGPPRAPATTGRDTKLGTPVGPERGPASTSKVDPRSGQTTPGMGAAGSGVPRTTGSSMVPAGDVVTVRADDVRVAFRRDPHTVFHSASDEWHQVQWQDQLKIAGQWTKEMAANPPPAPMAFRMKGGGIQVNDLQWKNSGYKLSEINRPSQLGGSAETGPPRDSSEAAAGVPPVGAGAAGGRGGTQVGVPPGPSGSSEATLSKTQVGVPPGPGRTLAGSGSGKSGAPDILASYPLRVPQRPRLGPVRDEIQPATRAEVVRLFQDDPRSVVVSGGKQFHEYVWRMQRWEDGRPTKEPAPVAFRSRNGSIRVDGDRWVAEGGKVEEILEPGTVPRVEPTALEAAPTLPAAPAGPGATNVSIVPGSRKPRR